MNRAAVCIGVNSAGTMGLLRAAEEGAQQFEIWARDQGCDTSLLIGGDGPVTVNKVFREVNDYIQKGTYDVLIVYFSGHGILTAPGTEYWLLSEAPENPNEAVNLLRSIEDARNSGIAHVIFVSDACRSAVKGPPLSGVSGGVIFPNRGMVGTRAEVDVYYATRPGDPAYEIAQADATQAYRGIFTECLLDIVTAPPSDMIDTIPGGTTSLKVLTSRKLKPYLETTVQIEAAAANIKLRQIPEVRVETALPKFFALVEDGTVTTGKPTNQPPRPKPAEPWHDLRGKTFGGSPPVISSQPEVENMNLLGQVDRLLQIRGRGRFETETGFSVFGAKPVRANAKHWHAEFIFAGEASHIRLVPSGPDLLPATIVIEFESGSAVPLGILKGFIGTIVVDEGRVTSVNYVPSNQTPRFQEYQRNAPLLEKLKAQASVASRNGFFLVPERDAASMANYIRQGKGLDPTLGMFAAYAYAQVGNYKDVVSVFNYMREVDFEIPVPFDVVMLATIYQKKLPTPARFGPFCPMLSQGWAFLNKGDPLFRPLHLKIRPQLIPALWTTLTREGAEQVRAAIKTEEIT